MLNSSSTTRGWVGKLAAQIAVACVFAGLLSFVKGSESNRATLAEPLRGGPDIRVAAQFGPMAPELNIGTDWLNVKKPLSLADLRGRIVLLDFWTLC
jgi:hypothetical protein